MALAPRRAGTTHFSREGAVPIRLRLLLASVLMLFLELSLIRWSGAQVVHLSYFSNFVLLGSFLEDNWGAALLGAGRADPPRIGRPPLTGIAILLAVALFAVLASVIGRGILPSRAVAAATKRSRELAS